MATKLQTQQLLDMMNVNSLEEELKLIEAKKNSIMRRLQKEREQQQRPKHTTTFNKNRPPKGSKKRTSTAVTTLAKKPRRDPSTSDQHHQRYSTAIKLFPTIYRPVRSRDEPMLLVVPSLGVARTIQLVMRARPHGSIGRSRTIMPKDRTVGSR